MIYQEPVASKDQENGIRQSTNRPNCSLHLTPLRGAGEAGRYAQNTENGIAFYY